MSKPDLAGPQDRQAFDAIAAEQYPAKRYLGVCPGGVLPPEAMLPYSRAVAGFSLVNEDRKRGAADRQGIYRSRPRGQRETVESA